MPEVNEVIYNKFVIAFQQAGSFSLHDLCGFDTWMIPPQKST